MLINHRFITDRTKLEATTGCWVWTGFKTEKGYARQNGVRIHRAVYELFKGKIPDGMIVRHTCDNPSCCNPDHLVIGTNQDNMLDALTRGLLNGVAKNFVRRISDSQRHEIMQSNESISTLAERYGIHRVTVWKIRNGSVRKQNEMLSSSSGEKR